MPEPDYVIRQGNYGETITSVLLDDALAVIDLTGAGASFFMASIQGGSPVIASEGTVIDAGEGRVGYVFQNGDTDTAGLYLAEWRVTYLGGTTQTFPNGGYTLVRITPAVGE